MQARIITRTHYQAHEPAYLRVLIFSCTSAGKSGYSERVAGCLKRELEKSRIKFNLPASQYAVDLGRGLGLLSKNLAWTELAQVLNLVSSPPEGDLRLSLTLPERLLFFRVYLEADGAALLVLCRMLANKGCLPSEKAGWNDIANSLYAEVYEAYLDIATDPFVRATMRKSAEKRRVRPFKGKSGPHQVFIHLHALYRMGLVDRKGGGSGVTYRPGESSGRGIRAFVEAVPDVRTLEEIIERREWAEIACRVFAGQLPEAAESTEPLRSAGLLAEIAPKYRSVLSTGATLCSLETLFDSLRIDRLSSGRHLISQAALLDALRKLQAEYPREIRFHVDRFGRPAFLKIGDDLLA